MIQAPAGLDGQDGTGMSVGEVNVNADWNATKLGMLKSSLNLLFQQFHLHTLLVEQSKMFKAIGMRLILQMMPLILNKPAIPVDTGYGRR